MRVIDTFWFKISYKGILAIYTFFGFLVFWFVFLSGNYIMKKYNSESMAANTIQNPALESLP